MTCVVLFTESASDKWLQCCKLALLYRRDALAKALAEQPLAAAATIQVGRPRAVWRAKRVAKRAFQLPLKV